MRGSWAKDFSRLTGAVGLLFIFGAQRAAGIRDVCGAVPLETSAGVGACRASVETILSDDSGRANGWAITFNRSYTVYSLDLNGTRPHGSARDLEFRVDIGPAQLDPDSRSSKITTTCAVGTVGAQDNLNSSIERLSTWSSPDVAFRVRTTCRYQDARPLLKRVCACLACLHAQAGLSARFPLRPP